MSKPYETEYAEYLQRVGSIMSDGLYAKFEGQLVKRLEYDEFVERWEQFVAARQTYDDILRQGDTVNDAIVKMLNEHAAQLLLKV